MGEGNFKKLILYSKKDLAGRNIADSLRENYDFRDRGKERWVKNDLLLREFEGEAVSLDKLEEFRPDIGLVASRHSSKTGQPSLTVHSPGNFSQARLGGQARQLGIAPAVYLRETLLAIKNYGKTLEGYDISLESTHHGPTKLNFPLLFAEIGSTEKEWSNKKAGQVIARAIYETLDKKPQEKVKIAIGLGGGHYCRKFSKEKIINEFALGHLCPKYSLPYLNEKMLQEMINKTEPKPEYALVEKKGLGQEKQRVFKLLKKLELKLRII